REVEVRRSKVVQSSGPAKFKRALRGARFVDLTRRGKYLLFTLQPPRQGPPFSLLGHLGMTGRMYLQTASAPLAKHAAVVFSLGKTNFVFEDTRYFGRLTLETRSLETLGPEPLSDDFSVDYFARALNRSMQPIKVKLLDQSLVPGVGNIYANEALFRAGISPRLRARKLTRKRVERLRQSLRQAL